MAPRGTSPGAWVASCTWQANDVPPADDLLNWDSLPRDLKARILHRLPYERIFQFKAISRSSKEFIESTDHVLQDLPTTLTACYFFIANGTWQWAGLDPTANKWRRLPPLPTYLPRQCAPDTELFKEFLLCTKSGLVCMNFSKSPDTELLIVFNPLSGHFRELPPLIHRRNPVLMHLIVDLGTQSYQLLVAGSSRPGDETGSKRTEIFDSRSGKWSPVSDLPGPAFALNEYQTGVDQNDTIVCIGFVELPDGQVVKGVLGFMMTEQRWKMSPMPSSVMNCTVLQLVESYGDLYLFAEREDGRGTEHSVDRLEWGEAGCELVNVMKKRRKGGRSLEVYPESVLVPYREFQLCIFNTVDHSGEVCDLRDPGGVSQALPALPGTGFTGELGFFTLNPMSFVLEPRFGTKV